MDTNEPTQISSLSEFIEWVNQLGSTNYLLQGECLFRGVSDQSYEINASAYRRLGGKNNDLNKFHRLTEGRQPWQNRLKTLDICRCDQGFAKLWSK